MKFFRSFKGKAESKFYSLFFGFNNDIFVISIVQGTELINIEFYTENFHFTGKVPFLGSYHFLAHGGGGGGGRNGMKDSVKFFIPLEAAEKLLIPLSICENFMWPPPPLKAPKIQEFLAVKMGYNGNCAQ